MDVASEAESDDEGGDKPTPTLREMYDIASTGMDVCTRIMCNDDNRHANPLLVSITGPTLRVYENTLDNLKEGPEAKCKFMVAMATNSWTAELNEIFQLTCQPEKFPDRDVPECTFVQGCNAIASQRFWSNMSLCRHRTQTGR